MRISAIALLIGLLTGCASSQPEGERPKTLLQWQVGPEPKLEVEAEEGAEKKEEPLASDRPDFTEASSTVGKGRVQLESGYTFISDRSGDMRSNSHSLPEALLRIGMIADWFEFRIAQNYGSARSHSPDGIFGARGSEDLYLGAKLFVAEQRGVLPETAIVIQATIPTGHEVFTSGHVLPGFNLLYGWDVTEKITFAGSSQANRAIDADVHGYVEMAQSFTTGYSFTDKLGGYAEWFAFVPVGATAEGVTALHYANGGFTYKLTPNFQLDIRAGVGLSRNADDFFAGTGFAARY